MSRLWLRVYGFRDKERSRASGFCRCLAHVPLAVLFFFGPFLVLVVEAGREFVLGGFGSPVFCRTFLGPDGTLRWAEAPRFEYWGSLFVLEVSRRPS